MFQYGCMAKIKYEWSEHNTGWIPCWIGNDKQVYDLHAGHCWMPKICNAHQMTLNEYLEALDCEEI